MRRPGSVSEPGCKTPRKSVDICCTRPRSAANPPHVTAAVDRRDRQTDGRNGRTRDRYIVSAPHWRQRLRQHTFNGLVSRTTWVSWYQKGKTSLDLNEARDDGVLGCSGISWTICKQSAPRFRQITTPTSHQSILQAGCLSR